MMNKTILYKLSMEEFQELALEIRGEDKTFRKGGDLRRNVMEWYLDKLTPRVVIIYQTTEGSYFKTGVLTRYDDNVIDYTSEHKNQNVKHDDKKLKTIQQAMDDGDCCVYLAQRESKKDCFKVRRVESLIERNNEWTINCTQHIDEAEVAPCDMREICDKRHHSGKYKRGVAFMVGLTEDEVDFHLKFGKGGSPYDSYKVWY